MFCRGMKKPMAKKATTPAAEFKIRKARLEDFEEIYDIFCTVLDEGKTYSYSRAEMTPERSLAYWMTEPHTHCYVVDVEGKVAGMLAIRRNRTCHAAHVANASFIVHPDFRKRGIARAMGEFALKRAKKLGYKAMQFNFVVSVNTVAVKLWQSLGFKIVGTLPKGFSHVTKGFVDVYIMHRFL